MTVHRISITERLEQGPVEITDGDWFRAFLDEDGSIEIRIMDACGSTEISFDQERQLTSLTRNQ